MPYSVCHAQQMNGRPSYFALSIGKGVVIDALGYLYGAGMANHSCDPNAKLDFDYLRGSEHAPYAFLVAVKDIAVGNEIECDYGYLNNYTDAEIRDVIRSGDYIPCHCLKPSCRQVFVIN